MKFEKAEASIAAEVETVRTAAKERQRKGGAEKVPQTIGEPSKHDGETVTARAAMAGTNRQYMHDADTLAEPPLTTPPGCRQNPVVKAAARKANSGASEP